VEEGVVSAEPIEERVDSPGPQQLGEVPMELAEVVVVLPKRVKENAVVLSKLREDVLPPSEENSDAGLLVPTCRWRERVGIASSFQTNFLVSTLPAHL
jgi:hypothetical protein